MCCCRCMACRHQDMGRQGMPQYLALTANLQGTAMGPLQHLPILAMQLPSSRPTRSNNQVCCLSSRVVVCRPGHMWNSHQLCPCISLGKASVEQLGCNS